MFNRIKRAVWNKMLRKELKHIGENCMVNSSCTFTHRSNIEIGNNVSIQRDCVFSGHGGIVINDGVVIAHCVDVFSGEHNYNSEDLEYLPFDDRFVCNRVTIGPYCWIGSHVVILPGVTIGEGAVIGAGSVVTKDIPDFAIACGNPCRVVKYRNQQVYENLKGNNKSYNEYRIKSK